MFNEKMVLCGANAYDKKYYLNEQFSNLPEQIKQELQIMCVLFTEEVGGILVLEYDEEGNLQIITEADEGDLLYDDIGWTKDKTDANGKKRFTGIFRNVL